MRLEGHPDLRGWVQDAPIVRICAALWKAAAPGYGWLWAGRGSAPVRTSLLPRAVGVALFAWFIVLVKSGLSSWFDADDLMNLHYYWSKPWSALLTANLEFWSTYYRPAGGLFYRSLYGLWGFHAHPFRIAVLVLVSVNFALLAIVVWQLTGSRFSVLIALLLIGINPAFASAYFDTGTIYDVLAYAFFWGGFALYVRLRRGGRMPGWGGLALVFCLYVAALEAKEVAVSFPVAIGLYELIWHPPANVRPAELWRWIGREGRLAAMCGLACAVYLVGKRYGRDSLWLLGPYHPHYSVGGYFLNLSTYLCELIYKPVKISPAQMAALLAVMLALAVAARRRGLLWAVGFIAVGVLPLAFIPARGGFAYLVPSVGWAVYAGGFTDRLLEMLAGSRVQLRYAAQAVLFAVLVAVLAPWQRNWISMHAHAAHEMQRHDRNFIDQIRELIPAPRKGARILLLSDAEGLDSYDVYFAIRLYYRDPQLEVSRMHVLRDYHMQPDLKSYDYVLDWVDKRFVLVGNK